MSIALTPPVGDGTTTVFTAAAAVSNELFLVDRLPQIAGPSSGTYDYTSAIVGGVSVYTFLIAPPVNAILTLTGTIGSSAGTTPSNSIWPTAQQILSDVAVDVGLGVQASPYTSLDPNIQRLCLALQKAGQSLVNKHDWTHLDVEYLFTTVSGQEIYSMPPDFRSMYDQSGWVRSTRLPLGGPLSPQEWQFVTARLVGVTWTVLFRPQFKTIHVFPGVGATPAPLTIAFEFRSNWWVQTGAVGIPGTYFPNTTYTVGSVVAGANGSYIVVQAGKTSATGTAPTNFGETLDGGVIWKYLWGGASGGAPNTNVPVSNTDIIYFDRNLIELMTKAEFMEMTGLEGAEAARAKAQVCLGEITADDSPMPILNLAKRRRADPLLTTANLPLTGYGH